jgi:phospholipase/carboxylesterase
MSNNLSFIHRFEPRSRPDGPPLLLLHGTGGDESDLLPLGKNISPGSPLLSPRGKVLEGGMPRFFRRMAEGVFDEDDLRRRANDLAAFVEEASNQYGIAAPIALGYSNGANIAAAMLLLRPNLLAGAILLRAMVPLKEAPKTNLAGKPILILSGQFDPIIPSSNSSRLAAMLADDGARVRQNTLPVGHGLTQADVDLARKWIHEQAAVLPTEAPR